MTKINLGIRIAGQVSNLKGITTFHWFPDTGELGLYCLEGSWHGTGVKVEGLHAMVLNREHSWWITRAKY